jgi:hypothetical protein
VNALKSVLLPVVIVAVALAVTAVAHADSPKPLSEEDLTTLVKVKLADDVIISKLRESGINFALETAALERLKQAGASETVLTAVRQINESKRPALDQSAVTYEDVLKLVKLKVGEEQISQTLAASPTRFTLGAEQLKALREAGASERLIQSMQGERAGTPITKLTDLAIVFDCSGSMSEKTPDGRSKMDVAKKVLGDMVPRIPTGLRLTFIIYGHDKALECQAVKVVRELSPFESSDKQVLANYIAGLEPAGHTPIAASLRVAGQELAKRSDALCGLILITDGIETCHGDPAAEAVKLAKTLKLTFGVHVIGFGLNPKEGAAVEEIARSVPTGKYYAAQDAQGLNEALEHVTKRITNSDQPQRRAVKVFASAEGMFGQMKQISVYPAGKGGGPIWPSPVGTLGKYGEEIRLPSAHKYDLWWYPADPAGYPVLMVKDFSIPERKVVELQAGAYLGAVRITGSGLPEPNEVFVAKPGNFDNPIKTPTQRTRTFGKDMVVPAGTYEVYFQDKQGKFNLLERNLEVKPGKVVALD